MITVNDFNEVRLELELANKRLGEMEAVAHRGYEPLSTAIDGYEKNINLAFENAEKIGDALKLAGVDESKSFLRQGEQLISNFGQSIWWIGKLLFEKPED